MNPDWQEFLINAGAEIKNGTVIHFGNLRRETSVAITGNVFADLSQYGLISVHGVDASAFLQAQLTNDLDMVNEQCSQLSGYCNPKGRLLASMRIFKHGDSYYLCLPQLLVEPLINRLRMYVLRSQVTLDDASDTFIHLGVSGKEIENELRSVISHLPSDINDTTQSKNTITTRVPGIHPSFEIFTDTEVARELWDALNVRGAPIGSDAWTLLDILAGIPLIYPQTSETFIPQMINLQLIDGVSFKKGCYPGQEIVARMQYLGKLKRRMYQARLDTDQPPNPGDEIFTSGGEQAAGKVVSAAPHPDGGYILLVVLQISSAESSVDTLHLHNTSGPTLQLGNLPYPFPD